MKSSQICRRDLMRRAVAALGASALRGAGSARAAEAQAWVEATWKRLSLPEKVGQLLFTRTGEPGMEATLKAGRATAVFLSADTPEGTAAFTNRCQELSPTPLLFATGSSQPGMIVRGATEFPTNMAMAATRDERLVYSVGRAMSEIARSVGMDWPGPTSCDVNTNPLNPIISTRSFGDDVALVSRLSVALVRGLQEGRSIAWGYHFPGHGDTAEDSHIELPVLRLSEQRIRKVDLPPFQALIRAGVKSICTAHIWYPALEPTQGLPATLSSRILTGLLRGELGFRGLITSDSMAMQAIRKNFGIEGAVVMAFRAGVDLILAYPGTDSLHAALLKAVESDSALQKRLEESVRRILEVKAWVGLAQARPRDPQRARDVAAKAEHRELALRVARKAATCLKGAEFLRGLAARSRVLFVVTETKPRATGPLPHEEFVAACRKRFPDASFHILPAELAGNAREQCLTAARAADAIVVSVLTKVRAYDPGAASVQSAQADLIRELARTKPAAVAYFGAPYPLAQFREAEALFCCYDDAPASLQAGVEVCAGAMTPAGKLPVKVDL